MEPAAPSAPEPPVRPPLQARSRRTLTRIVNASRALVAERGRDAVTIQDIVARARTSIGSFYARFAGKDELLRFLDESAWADARARWDRELTAEIEPGDPLATRVRTLVGLLVETAQSPLDGARARELEHHMREGISRSLLEQRSEIRHPDPELALALGQAAVVGAARGRPEGWDDGQLIEELTRLWLGYLGAEPEDRRERPAAPDFFEVWA